MVYFEVEILKEIKDCFDYLFVLGGLFDWGDEGDVDV